MPLRIFPLTALAPVLAFALSSFRLAEADEPDTVSIAGQDTSSEGGFASYSGPLRAVHPAFRLIDLTPPGLGFRVTGLDLLSNGDLALVSIGDTVSPDYGGDVYVLKGARKAVSNDLTARRIYTGFQVPLGLAVADDSIYVSDLNGLYKLVDADGDGQADSAATVLAYPRQDAYRYLIWNMGLIHSGDRFYTGLGAYHFVSQFDSAPCAPYPTRGVVHSADRNGRSEVIGSGLREPNGVAIGPDGELFATDNDGEWVPTNRLVHVRKGAFYGMCVGTTWQPGPASAYARPAVWFPKLWRSPGQPMLMRAGPYRGQLAVGDYQILNLNRIFLEKVGGEYQGAIFPFTGGLITGAIRMAQDADGSLYLGELEIHSSEAWYFNGYPNIRPTHEAFGLQKMIPEGEAPFEMLAVRAAAHGFAIDFTRPASSAAASAASYRVTQWRYEPTYHYAGPRLDSEEVAIASASLSDDGKTAFLDLPGLKPDRVVYIQLRNDLRSRDGEVPWSYEAWYTLNAIPGREIGVRPASGSGEAAPFSVRRGGQGRVAIHVMLTDPYSLEVRNLRGKTVMSDAGEGPRTFALDASLPPGLYPFVLKTANRSYRGLVRPF
jgi:hypothetical protein